MLNPRTQLSFFGTRGVFCSFRVSLVVRFENMRVTNFTTEYTEHTEKSQSPLNVFLLRGLRVLRGKTCDSRRCSERSPIPAERS